MFEKGQVVTLRPDWREIETELSIYTSQLAAMPENTEYTVRYVSKRYTTHWAHLSWIDSTGQTRTNCYEASHFTLAPVQTTEELIEENESLNEQIGRLEKQAEELQAKIARKYEFIRLNTETIQANLPENIRKYIPYL